MCSVARGWTVGFFAVEAGGILEVLGLKALSDLLHGGALFLSLLNELIVDIGDVGNIEHLVAAVLKVAAQGIEHDQRAGVADVDIVINGRAADIDAVFTGHLRPLGIVFAGELPVAFRVDLLQVENDQTGGLHQPVETGQIIRVIGPEGLPGGIQSRVHAFGAGQLEECRQELHLAQRLAAADRDAALLPQ